MARLSVVVGCVLFGVAQAASQEGPEETAAIRRHSEQYAVAICKKDATALDHFLASDYSSQDSSFYWGGDKKAVIGYFTDSDHRTFRTLKTDKVNIRLYGDTGVETGAVHAEGTAYGAAFTWGGVRYSRVWLKRAGVWRIVHEHLG